VNECTGELEAIWQQWSRYPSDSSLFLNKDWEIKTNSPTYRERIFAIFFDRVGTPSFVYMSCPIMYPLQSSSLNSLDVTLMYDTENQG
jgi:hypothetical protein